MDKLQKNQFFLNDASPYSEILKYVRSLKVTMGWLLELLSELTKKIVRQLAYTKPNNKLQQRDKEKIQKIPGLKFTANSNTVLKNPRILGFCKIKFLITLGPVSRCC